VIRVVNSYTTPNPYISAEDQTQCAFCRDQPGQYAVQRKRMRAQHPSLNTVGSAAVQQCRLAAHLRRVAHRNQAWSYLEQTKHKSAMESKEVIYSHKMQKHVHIHIIGYIH
jgi:hypothetical protein